MKYKIMAAISAAVVLVIISGVIAGLASTVKRQRAEISELSAQVEKSNAEKAAYIKTIEEYREIERKYKEKKPAVSESLSSAAVDDFNSLLSLWLSDGQSRQLRPAAGPGAAAD